jgi:acyl-CoA synthetase (NDP forming)
MGVVEELERIFHPRGLAIVGASNKPGNLGAFFLGGFIQQGFDKDKIYVVHPTENEVGGIKAYPTAQDIPGDVDLAVVFSPRRSVPQVVRDCTLKGIKGVVICTSGFAENSADGAKLQREMVATARSGGTRLIGPNCVGIYCPSSNLVNFAGMMPRESGPVGMFSHSGSLSVMFPVAAAAKGIHFSKAISCGNSCDLNESDFMEYFGQDPETEIVVAYMEGVHDGRRFFQLARDISKRKPIIVWKCGDSDVGSRAAASHTGALAGSPQVWDAAFRQSGMIRAESADDVLDLLQAFYYLPLPRGNRVAIVSGMGGMGVAIADNCMEYGLEVAELTEVTKKRLDQFVPEVGTCPDNPVDLGMGSAFNRQLYIDTAEALGRDENVDTIIMTTGSWQPNYVNQVMQAMKGVEKPIVFVTTQGLRIMMEEPRPVKGVAIYDDGRRAVRAIAKMVQYRRYRSGQQV